MDARPVGLPRVQSCSWADRASEDCVQGATTSACSLGLREHPRSVWVCENSRLGPSRPKTGTGPLLPSPHSCAFLAVAHECSAAPAGTPEGAPGGTNTCCPPGALGYAGHRPNTGASLNGADETSIQRKTLLVSCPMSCASRVCASS